MTQEGKNDKRDSNSELFTVRLWIEQLAEGLDYRGQVKHVVSGTTRHFREWGDLEAFLIGTFDVNEEESHGEADAR